jgi:hypothetical protein
MISAKEFHQQIESLAVSLAFDGQHVFANLSVSFQNLKKKKKHFQLEFPLEKIRRNRERELVSKRAQVLPGKCVPARVSGAKVRQIWRARPDSATGCTAARL